MRTLAALLLLTLAAQAQSPAKSVIVTSKFGGQIFGFDIDQNGTQGILAEAKSQDDGTVVAAVETFDQNTGKILKVIAKSQTQDDFITFGIFGGTALVEREHALSLLHVVRTIKTLSPLTAAAFTGTWTPPIDGNHIISQVSRTQGGTKVAAWAEDLSGNFIPQVFSSDVATNTFGPLIPVTDQNFTFADPPRIAYDDQTNQAILGHQTLSPFLFEPPTIAIVDLATGNTDIFTGVGLGIVNGMAVSSDHGIASAVTELDYSVQFYDLASHFGLNVRLPNANNQIHSATNVEYDALHHIFLVAQPSSSTSTQGSSIHIYDVSGSYVKSINGLNFFNSRFNVEPVHIALNPSKRIGFVDGPDQGFTQIQQFHY